MLELAAPGSLPKTLGLKLPPLGWLFCRNSVEPIFNQLKHYLKYLEDSDHRANQPCSAPDQAIVWQRHIANLRTEINRFEINRFEINWLQEQTEGESAPFAPAASMFLAAIHHS